MTGGGITLVLGVQRFLGYSALSDKPLLLFGFLLLIIATQFITLGFLAEMLARIYHESQQKPIYVSKEILSLASQESLSGKK